MNISEINLCELREIYDVTPIDNLDLRVKIIRVFIRYSLNFLPHFLNIKALKVFKFLSVLIINKDINRYCKYLVKLNLFRANYLNYLRQNDFKNAVKQKIKWSKFVIKHSNDSIHIDNANDYLKVMGGSLLLTVKHQENSLLHTQPSKKFYIMGPNYSHNQNDLFLDHTVVHLKPFQSSVEKFSGSMLFLNDFTYRSLLSSNIKEQVIDLYDEIYVSSKNEKLNFPFQRAKFLSQGYIASPMALQRIIFNLTTNYPGCHLIIDGFDFYLSQNPYSDKKYFKKNRGKNSLMIEKEIIISLADHDFLFNFQLTKQLLKNATLNGSQNFINLLDISSERYMKEIAIVRDFSVL